MSWRAVIGGVLAAGFVIMTTPASQANPTWDPGERFSGGAPTNRSGSWGWGFFGGGGGSGPIPRQTVLVSGQYAPGTIIVNTTERRLYYMLGDGQAIRYGIGVGRIGFQWSGVKTVSAKREWPDWTPPAQMLRRRPD